MNLQSLSTRAYILIPSLLTRLSFINSVPGKQYLDFGCGSGTVLRQNLLVRPDLQTSAVDIEDHSKALPNEIYFKLYDGHRLPFPSTKFDIVTANHVFEHIKAPDKALREVFRVLKPEGFLYIEVPGTRSLFRRNKSARFAGCVDFKNDRTHIKPFSPEELCQLGINAGFTPVDSGITRNWLHVFLAPFLVFAGLCLPRSLFFMYGRNAILGWSSYVILKKSIQF